MILFCDTSALVKLHVQEEFSGQMLSLGSRAQAIAVSRIAWAETMAALARRAREVPADAPVIESCKKGFQEAWATYAIVEINQPLVELAGDLADAFALSAYDSVQLASAKSLKQHAPDDLIFACFDRRLQKAATMMGIESYGGD